MIGVGRSSANTWFPHTWTESTADATVKLEWAEDRRGESVG